MIETTKLHEKSFQDLAKLIIPKTYPAFSKHYPQLAYPTTKQLRAPTVTKQLVINPFSLTYPTQRGQDPFKPDSTLEVLNKQNSCFKCHELFFPGHQCKPKNLSMVEGTEVVEDVYIHPPKEEEVFEEAREEVLEEE